MQIPKSFKLGKQEWTVTTHGNRPYLYGRVHPEYRVVQVCINYTPKRSESALSETFWHEVTHAILHDMNDPRWNDEKFVTAFSKRLNQVINTAKL